MKKLLIAILATAGLLLGMSSCHKYCQCKYYEAGTLIYDDGVEDITGDWKNCLDFEYDLNEGAYYDSSTKTGWKCY